MNFKITNKITKQFFYRNFNYYTCVQQNVKQSSRISSSTVCQHRNENCSSNFIFPNHFSKKFSNQAIFPSYLNFQRRSISSETVGKNSENLSKISIIDLTPTNEAVKMNSNSYSYELLSNLSNMKIVQWAQDLLLQVHEITGLPWWASIILTSFALRMIVTFPFTIIQIHNNAKLEMIKEEMDETVKQLKKEANYACTYHGWPESLARQKYAEAVQKEWKKLEVRENCHPAKSYVVMWLQFPVWFAFTIATRNLCSMLPYQDIKAQIIFVELTTGGFGWMTNLTEPDHLIIPILMALINLSIIEVHQMFRDKPMTKIEKWKCNLFRGISLLIIPISGFVPAATSFYWLSSSLYGMLQAFIIHSLRVRRFFGVPIVESELEHPYRHFYSKLKSRLRLSKE